MTEPASQVYVFDGFHLDAQRRVLSGPDGQPIPLTPRVFDALLYFTERSGQLLSKERLLQDLWPNVVVEEHNLNKTVSELRRVLGEKPGEHRFIVTKPGHGYRFVATVSIKSGAAPGVEPPDGADGEAHRPAGSRASAGRNPRFETRNWALGIVAAAVAVVAFAGVRMYVDGSAEPAERAVETDAGKSIAVLRFVDRSADGSQTWVADGLAEQILNSLAQLRELDVTGRASSFRFQDQPRDVREIGQQLRVAHVLDGSVQVADGNLRVTAQLIRAADGRQLWSNSYDGTTSDVLAFQRDIAERVAAALEVVLDEGRRAAMLASGTQNVEAFREYQEGWRIYHLAHARQTQQSLWDANRHFERAMELDPRFGLAAVGRSDAFAHFLFQPLIPLVANSPYSREEALQLLRQTFGFVTESSTTPTMRLAYRIQSESLASSWEQMLFLLSELRRQWDVDALTFEGGADAALWLPQILWLAGQHDLVRMLAERHVRTDPLSMDAWTRRVSVELHARDFAAARDVLAQAQAALGEPILPNEQFRLALLEVDRARAVELLKPFPNQEGAMVTAALNGEHAAALAIADELESRFESVPAGAHLGGLLYTYYELGEVERSRALVKRIDESVVGAHVFMSLLAVNGGAPYFDLEAAPNLVKKLAQIRVDPASLRPMTRVSAVQ